MGQARVGVPIAKRVEKGREGSRPCRERAKGQEGPPVGESSRRTESAREAASQGGGAGARGASSEGMGGRSTSGVPTPDTGLGGV